MIADRREPAMNGGALQLPPGFRFHPTDEELVMHYLRRKSAGLPVAVPIVAELDLYKYEPWQLPGMASYGEKEWYFFSPRDRKYPNGSRPNRAAGSGYWKATGADKPVGAPKPVAIKKALVFYSGKAPSGHKTNWIMHEYCLADVDRLPRRKNSLRLDDWVLCRIYNKKGSNGSDKFGTRDRKPAGSRCLRPPEDRKPALGPHAPLPLPAGIAPGPLPPAELADSFAPSDSIPRLHADSSCSEHVLSPEFKCEREVQSQPRWRPTESDRAFAPAANSVFPHPEPGLLSSELGDSSFQDILVYLENPFEPYAHYVST